MDKKHWHFLKEVSGNPRVWESPLDFSVVMMEPKIKLMILRSLRKQQKIVERRIVKYLKDVWSARPSQGGRQTLEVEPVRYPTVPRQPNDKDWFVRDEMLWTVPGICQQRLLAVVFMESKLHLPRHSISPQDS